MGRKDVMDVLYLKLGPIRSALRANGSHIAYELQCQLSRAEHV